MLAAQPIVKHQTYKRGGIFWADLRTGYHQKELLENGTIPGRMIRGRWRCHKQAVDNWLMGNSAQTH